MQTKKILVVPLLVDVINQPNKYGGGGGGDSIIDHRVGKNEESVG